jgi:hypothetical protein
MELSFTMVGCKKCFILDETETSSGTLTNGEGRLLFSSAQIEYIRYWLHAMGLTKEPIPIPYSKCLLTMEHDLSSVSPWIYNDADMLKRSIKVGGSYGP